MAISEPVAQSTLFERLVRLVTKVRNGEGRCIALFASHAFLIMASYYVLKALRESFLLAGSGAEIRAYAVAVNGLVLMALVPLYSALRRRVDGRRLVRWVSGFFAVNILMFAIAFPFRSGKGFGFAFFIWVSVYGLMVVSQFWALAANTFNTKAGQRLFPAIMLGATIGALAGAQLTSLLLARTSPLTLLLLGALLLVLSILLIRPETDAVPPASRQSEELRRSKPVASVLGGFHVVFKDRYLMLVAAFVVLLNCIGSTGDYLLASLIEQRAGALAGVGATLESREAIIGGLYARFQLWTTLIGFLLQALLVSRIYRLVGVRGALLVLPFIALFVYSGIAFLPIFSVIYAAKIIENATNYSLMNTTQQALYLPTDTAAKFDGKTTIETFFWRFGDILQAGFVFLGLNYLGWGTAGFALLNVVLCLAWIGLAVLIGRRYSALARAETHNTAPTRACEESLVPLARGVRFEHALPVDLFMDPDPGDVLVFEASDAAGAPLPQWMRFHVAEARFWGVVPHDAHDEYRVKVVAIDMEGATVSSFVVFRCSTA